MTYLRILHGRFLWYFLGQVTYALGGSTALVILSLSIFYAFHGSPAAVSMLFLLRFGPVMLIGLVSGPIIRQIGALHVLRSSPMVFAACIIGWSLFPTMPWVWGFIALYHLAFGLFKASRMTALAEMVTDHGERTLATGLLFGSNEAVGILAGVLGGWLYTACPVSVSGAILAIFVVTGGLMMGRLAPREAVHDDRGSWRDELRRGWQYVLRTPTVRALAAVLIPIWTGMGVITAMLLYLFIAYWHGGAGVYGWGVSAEALGNAGGMLIAPLFIYRWGLPKMTQGLSRLLVTSGVLYMIFAQSHAWVVGIGLLMVCALTFNASTAIDEVLEQSLPSERWRAQSISAISTVGTFGYVLGAAGAPYLLRWLKPPDVTSLGAILVIGAGLLSWVMLTPAVSNAQSREHMPGEPARQEAET